MSHYMTYSGLLMLVAWLALEMEPEDFHVTSHRAIYETILSIGK